MQSLAPSDQRIIEFAQGWLELGSPSDAERELAALSAAMLQHPHALKVRWEICSRGRKWEECIELGRALSEAAPEEPFGWIHWAFALHELKRTREAYDVLLPQSSKFPTVLTISYNLACYLCQLGKMEEALLWLESCFASSEAEEYKRMALKDPDLQPLWGQIG